MIRKKVSVRNALIFLSISSLYSITCSSVNYLLTNTTDHSTTSLVEYDSSGRNAIEQQVKDYATVPESTWNQISYFFRSIFGFFWDIFANAKKKFTGIFKTHKHFSKKDMFFENSFNYDNHYNNDAVLPITERIPLNLPEGSRYSAKELTIKSPQNPPSGPRHNEVKEPEIKYSKDSVFEMFRLMFEGKEVAANTAANAKYVGGGFTTNLKNRNGKGSQEEGTMAVLYGLSTSLLRFSEGASETHRLVKRDKNQGRFKYRPGIFSGHILFSKNLHPKISMKLWENYSRNKKDYEFITDYFAHEHASNSDMCVDTKHNINIYSIAAFDRRGKELVNYKRLKNDTYYQISTMLEHAKSEGTRVVVITVPGSGIFSRYKFGSNPKKDPKYLNAVKSGTIEAVRNHKKGLEEIVICGL